MSIVARRLTGNISVPRFRACVPLVFAIAVLLVGGCGSSEDLGGSKLPTDASSLIELSAAGMGDVDSVRFSLARTGAPVYIDQVESLALDALEGRFSRPGSADALMDVTVNDSLRTKLGAVAIDDEIWMSNPVTGVFETLPPGFDIDPSLFFDPENGWRPLIAELTDVTFIAEEEREGTRYHLRGTATEANMRRVTAGLVRQDVAIDLWLHPVSALVTDMTFDTDWLGATSSWELTLRSYGEEFDITDPTLDD